MKKTRKIFFLITMGILLLVLLNGSVLGASEVEPNNDYTQSTSLGLEDSLTGKLNGISDNDYYKIDIPENGQLNLQFKGTDDTILFIYNSTREYLFGTAPNDFSILFEKGTYYIEIYKINEGEIEYTLETKFTSGLIPIITNLNLEPKQFNHNGFNKLNISFNISENANVLVSIYDSEGNSIKSLSGGFFKKGKNTIVWDGKDFEGKDVNGGKYYFLVNAYSETNLVQTIKSDLLEVIRPQKINKSGTINNNNIKFLASPSTNGKIIKKLTKGTAVTVLELDGNWYKIKMKDGKIGYIEKKYITLKK